MGVLFSEVSVGRRGTGNVTALITPTAAIVETGGESSVCPVARHARRRD